MAIELESSMPTVAPQSIMNLAPTPVSTTSLIQHAPSVPYIADSSSPPMHMKLLLQEQEEVCSATRLVVAAGTFFLIASALK
ncbi:hypothetical protein C0995_016559 [Termitomyces sp. Mi166|nr:hypothetical protein C0995_016559 [Termitomyces sp. Mi166\